MKKTIYTLALVTSLSSCVTNPDTVENQKSTSDSVSYYRNRCDSLELRIQDLNEQISILEDGIQLREGEISFWGQKYDSCMTILKKRK